METRDHAAWMAAIPRPGTLSFYQYRIAELAANATEAAVREKKAAYNSIYTNMLDAHTQALKELKKKHRSFATISNIPLEPVKQILKIHWKYASEAGL